MHLRNGEAIAQTRDPSLRMPQLEGDDEVAVLARTLEGMLRELDAARGETESMLARQEEITKEASQIAVSRITCPTLVLRGAKSDVLTDESGAGFARALPDGRWLRVEDAGHTVQGDNPHGLVEALRPFLREIKL